MSNMHEVVWQQCYANDIGKVEKFYTSLMGWTVQNISVGGQTYSVFMNGADRVGGVVQIDATMPGAVPCWLPFIKISDVKAASAKVVSLGGKVLPPRALPGLGTGVVTVDPNGGTFVMVQTTVV